MTKKITREQFNIFSEWIWNELQVAEKKFPVWPDDNIHGAAIIGEEAGEILKAALKKKYQKEIYQDNIIKETIQTATMCLRLWNVC